MSDQNYKLPKNCNFDTVANNSTLSSECSPVLTPRYHNSFRGLLINAPEKILWPKNYKLDDMSISPAGEILEGKIRFPIAGRYSLEGFYSDRDIGFEILITAVDTEGKVYSGKMDNLVSRVENLKDAPLDLAGQPFTNNSDTATPSYSGGTFNIDLVQNLGMPLKATTYIVYASFENYKSNTLTITIDIEADI